MRILMIIIFLLFCAANMHAQTAAPTNLAAAYNLDRMSDFRGLNNSELMMGIPLPPGKVVGNSYLSEEWKTGTVLLYENARLIERYPIRYDIQTNEVEIKASNGVKALSAQKIKSFTWIDSPDAPPSYFINAKDFKLAGGSELSGFLQVLEDGSVPLFKRTSIQIKKADYNVSLNVGSTDDKILKKEEYYLLYNGQLAKIPGSKKKLLPFFGDHADILEQFIKESNLGVTKEEDLRVIFRHYNSLTRAK